MKTTRKRFRIPLRRGIQAVSLLLFLWLLRQTAGPVVGTILPVDSFLRMDPLVAVAVPLAAREWIDALLPGLIVLFVAVVAGRVFCGYVCPMGTTLDLAGAVARRGIRKGSLKTGDPLPKLRWGKYLILAVMLGAALTGVNAVFWASPIPLITRFYALLLHPVLTLAGSEGLELGRGLFGELDFLGLEYLQIATRRYYTLYFLLFFFGALFILERGRPRFWCRFLCPAGALLGLLSLRPFWRRRVHDCNACTQCARKCPTGAIAPGAERATAHPECIACRTCVSACPKHGAAFGFGSAPSTVEPPEEGVSGELIPAGPSPMPSRRAFLLSAGGGAVLAAVELSATGTLLSAGSGGTIWPATCIRPPGALPEPDFLDRCVRCGQCMKACPTNALQPAWLAAGTGGMFSPVLVLRRGACVPECNACGMVCPTGAIHKLPLAEKNWAKVGTAVINPGTCLAWAEGRRCVVCEEVCPYGAITSVQTSGQGVAVPVVAPARCFGCGYCEQFCPVRVPAIVIQPLNVQRLPHSAFEKTGREIGLNLSPTGAKTSLEPAPSTIPDGALPPGFLE